MSRGSMKVLPESGAKPTLTNASIKLADSAATRISQANAKLHPAPAATPFPGRTRPLCPYPQFAHYKGTGDINLAANFECRADKHHHHHHDHHGHDDDDDDD